MDNMVMVNNTCIYVDIFTKRQRVRATKNFELETWKCTYTPTMSLKVLFLQGTSGTQVINYMTPLAAHLCRYDKVCKCGFEIAM